MAFISCLLIFNFFVALSNLLIIIIIFFADILIVKLRKNQVLLFDLYHYYTPHKVNN